MKIARIFHVMGGILIWDNIGILIWDNIGLPYGIIRDNNLDYLRGFNIRYYKGSAVRNNY